MARVIIGLTGLIGSGKTTVLNVFEKKYNYKIFNSDLCVADLMQNNSSVIKKISSKFKETLVNNKIDKKILRQIVYNDYINNIEIVEKIVVPFVVKDLKSFIKEHKKNNIIIEAPLLFESKIDELCDFIILTQCPKTEQVKRVLERDKMPESVLKAILKKQGPNSKFKKPEYKRQIDFYLDTNITIGKLEQKIAKIVKDIS